MASRLHRIIQNELRQNPERVFTSIELFSICNPDADPTDRVARTSFSRTLRRLKLPVGWEIREAASPTQPHVIFNTAHHKGAI